MLSLLALALQLSDKPFKETTFDGLFGKGTLLIRTPVERLEPPKRSPKQGWEFDWSTAGYAGKNDAEAKSIRFELFSQESTASSARPESVMRTLLRLFTYNYWKLNVDHAPDFAKVVTVYLCYGGQPGGEQLFDVDNSIGGQKVDTVYFYDLRSFTDPVETCREVAHEYAHATLPPLGGDYTAPEAWANGYLGERLYMSYLAEARTKGALGPEDTFGATPESLRAWVRKNVDPLVVDAMTCGPRPALLARKDKAAMDAAIGIVLETARIYGPRLAVKALFINGTDPKALLSSALEVVSMGPSSVTVDVPEGLRGKPIWIPVGEVSKKALEARTSAADVLEVRAGWAHIRPRYSNVKPVIGKLETPRQE